VAGGCLRLLPFTHFLEALMKSILSTALLFGVCGLAGAADKIEPVGTWNCEYEISGTKLTATLKIKKDGDKLAGTMTWPNQAETKVKDLKLKDDTLTFSVVRKVMDNDIPVEYKLTINGDELKGKATADLGAGKQDIDFNGKREKKDK
jgi:hypothetical protein